MPSLPSIQRAMLAWHEAHALPAPWRETRGPYACLIAAVMAQQTQMSRVLPAYARFIAAFPTLDALAGATPGAVIRAWAGMGYNQRAVRLQTAARTIAGSRWPLTAAELALIDGIGPFTAGVIASFAFGEPVACVDTNVRRVLGRLAGDEAIEGSRLRDLADACVPAGAPDRWNQALMDYGALVCGRRPKCAECVVAKWCGSRAKYAGALAVRVAEPSPAYRAPRRTEGRFEGSTRYFRGRIVDALRVLPPGGSISLRALSARIANNGNNPTIAETRALVAALERDGLARVTGTRVSLPGEEQL